MLQLKEDLLLAEETVAGRPICEGTTKEIDPGGDADESEWDDPGEMLMRCGSASMIEVALLATVGADGNEDGSTLPL